MPRLSSNGQVCAPGTGGGPVSVDGVVVHPSGGDANWFTDREIAFQGCDESCQILGYDITTGQTRVLDAQGGNWVRARDGGWAAWLNGQIRTSAGWVYPGVGYLADVVNGRVILSDSSQANLTSYSLGGQQLGETLYTGPLGMDATAGLHVRFRDGLLMYAAAGVWHLFVVSLGGLTELPLAPRDEGISTGVPLLVNGRPWVMERSWRLTLRPYNSTQGYVVTEGLCYGPDAVPYMDGARVAWATTQGESPDSVFRDTQYFTRPPMELNGEPPAIIVDPPPIIVDPPPVTVDPPPIIVDPPPIYVPVETHVLKGRLVR